jgi:hypothetical protein
MRGASDVYAWRAPRARDWRSTNAESVNAVSVNAVSVNAVSVKAEQLQAAESAKDAAAVGSSGRQGARARVQKLARAERWLVRFSQVTGATDPACARSSNL